MQGTWLFLSQLQTGTGGTVTAPVLPVGCCPHLSTAISKPWGCHLGRPRASQGSPGLLAPSTGLQGCRQRGCRMRPAPKGIDQPPVPPHLQPHLLVSQVTASPAHPGSLGDTGQAALASAIPPFPSRHGSRSRTRPNSSFWEAFSSTKQGGKTCSKRKVPPAASGDHPWAANGVCRESYFQQESAASS